MLGGRDKLFFTLMILFFSLNLSAQKVQVKGGFVEDSLLIGGDVRYWLTATYPPNLEMSFPDSLYTFTPFEFSGKEYFPTVIRDGLAFDSTIYIIQSYEIDKVQYFQLPAAVLNGADSTVYQSDLDSIFLTELAPFVSDSTKLRKNLAFQNVNRQFNYPLMYYILGGLLLLAVVLLLIFGKRIIKWIKLRRLRKQYEKFSETFSAYIKQLKVDPEPNLAEQALSSWKQYQQRLEKVPFSVMTTKEILAEDFTKELNDPLKSIDRVVYGRRIQENVFQDFQQIEDFTQDRYSKKVMEIRHGK